MVTIKRIFLTLVIFFCSLLVFAQQSAGLTDSILKQISTESYRSHFDSIHCHEGMNRKVSEGYSQSTDHDACRDYIFRSLNRYLGSENVYLHKFDRDKDRGLANVIGFKKGINPEKGVILVSAHYDSNNNREEINTEYSPGANDNGTGIAAVLEIARVMASYSTEYSILFAAWDLEEQYTYGYGTGSNRWYLDYTYRAKRPAKTTGSWEKKIARNKIIANINFDMFGHPGDTIEGKPVLWACSGNFLHKKFIDEYISVFQQYIPNIKIINKGEMDYSDHFTFGARNIPAIENLESDYDNDPYYHTCNDNLENEKNIDFTFAMNVTRGGLAFLIKKANCINKRFTNDAQTFPFVLRENSDSYIIEGIPEGGIIQIHDKYGNPTEGRYYKGSLWIYPSVSGLYRFTYFVSDTPLSRSFFLQKKEGLPVPF